MNNRLASVKEEPLIKSKPENICLTLGIPSDERWKYKESNTLQGEFFSNTEHYNQISNKNSKLVELGLTVADEG